MSYMVRDNWYQLFFPYKEVYKLLGCQTGKQNREYAFFSTNATVIRHKYFDTYGDLLSFANSNKVSKPHTLHFGAIFDINKNSKSDRTAVSRELTFDVDLQSYDWNDKMKQGIRTCHSRDEACEKCYKIADCGMKIINWILINVLGLENLTFVYSGNKGFHCIANDDIIMDADDIARKAIVEYFNPKFIFTNNPTHYTNSIINSVYDNIVGPVYLKILQEQNTDKLFDDKRVRRNMDEKIAACSLLWPILDNTVTEKMDHLLKVPLNIHPKSNRVCWLIKPDEGIWEQVDRNEKELENAFAAGERGRTRVQEIIKRNLGLWKTRSIEQ